jgi:hypothetical protein
MLGTISQTFGVQREFAAFSSAVIGAATLSLRRGKVIFTTAMINSLRHERLLKARRRKIRAEVTPSAT